MCAVAVPPWLSQLGLSRLPKQVLESLGAVQSGSAAEQGQPAQAQRDPNHEEAESRQPGDRPSLSLGDLAGSLDEHRVVDRGAQDEQTGHRGCAGVDAGEGTT